MSTVVALETELLDDEKKITEKEEEEKEEDTDEECLFNIIQSDLLINTNHTSQQNLSHILKTLHDHRQLIKKTETPENSEKFEQLYQFDLVNFKKQLQSSPFIGNRNEIYVDGLPVEIECTKKFETHLKSIAELHRQLQKEYNELLCEFIQEMMIEQQLVQLMISSLTARGRFDEAARGSFVTKQEAKEAAARYKAGNRNTGDPRDEILYDDESRITSGEQIEKRAAALIPHDLFRRDETGYLLTMYSIFVKSIETYHEIQSKRVHSYFELLTQAMNSPIGSPKDAEILQKRVNSYMSWRIESGACFVCKHILTRPLINYEFSKAFVSTEEPVPALNHTKIEKGNTLCITCYSKYFEHVKKEASKKHLFL